MTAKCLAQQLDWYGSYLDRATFQWSIVAECYMGSHIGGNRAPKNITLHHNLYANLLTSVGAYKPSRDSVDLRIVKSVRDKTGAYRVSTTGPWPDLASGAPSPPADSDHDCSRIEPTVGRTRTST